MLQDKNNKEQPDKFNLEAIAPELAKMNKTNPFMVPGNYFEKLPDEIMNKIRIPKRISPSELLYSIFLMRKLNFAIIVTGIILILAILIFNKSGDISANNQFLSNITLDDLLRENPEIIEYMDETLIVETLFAGSDQVIDFNSSNEFENDSSISEDDLINYLSDEEIATELMYEL
jgi:hypothetical protein